MRKTRKKHARHHQANMDTTTAFVYKKYIFGVFKTVLSHKEQNLLYTE